MRSRPFRFLLVLATTSGLACTRTPSFPRVPEEADQNEGRRMFEKGCMPCHGADGGGDGPRVAELPAAPPDLRTLTERHGRQFPTAYVIDVVTGAPGTLAHDRATMPVWSDRLLRRGASASAVGSVYQRWRLEGLAAYIESLQLPNDRE